MNASDDGKFMYQICQGGKSTEKQKKDNFVNHEANQDHNMNEIFVATKNQSTFSKYMYSEYFVNVIELIVILSIYFQTKVSCTSDMLVL